MSAKYTRCVAMAVAEDIIGRLIEPLTVERIEIAGSIRRQKPLVGDIELLYIPKVERRKLEGDMFAQGDCDLAAEAILKMIRDGMLAKRRNVNGTEMFGPRNKLCVHVASGIPVDLFATSAEAWSNYLVCRTGPADLNTLIAAMAKARGWRWNPYGPGFSAQGDDRSFRVESEQDVFAFVGLPYREPGDREALVANTP